MEMHGNRKTIGYQFPTASLVWGHVGTWRSLECMCREQAKPRVTECRLTFAQSCQESQCFRSSSAGDEAQRDDKPLLLWSKCECCHRVQLVATTAASPGRLQLEIASLQTMSCGDQLTPPPALHIINVLGFQLLCGRWCSSIKVHTAHTAPDSCTCVCFHPFFIPLPP